MNRDLDRLYFCVKRDERLNIVCFSDLTDEEMDAVLEGRNKEWLKSVCKILGRTIKRIGEEHDIVGREEDEEEE